MKTIPTTPHGLRRFALAALIAALLGAGCTTPPAPPADCRVTVAPELCRRLWVTDVRLQKGETQPYVFHANVANAAHDVTRVDYKVVWLDANGFEIPSVVSTWQAYSLAPLEIGAVRATAPSTAAVDFRFYIKEAR